MKFHPGDLVFTRKGRIDDVFNQLSMRAILQVGGPEVGYHTVPAGIYAIVLIPHKAFVGYNTKVDCTFVITECGIGWMRAADLEIMVST